MVGDSGKALCILLQGPRFEFCYFTIVQILIFSTLVQTLNSDKSLQTALLNDLIDDTTQEEVVALCSTVIEERKYKAERDKTVAGLVEEVFVMPEVQRQVNLSVWSLLFDISRTLPHEEYLQLKKKEDRLFLDPVARAALLSHVLEEDNRVEGMKEEKILSEVPWDVLAFNYHKDLQKKALSSNTALKMLQARLVIQAAREEIFQEGLLDALEEDLKQRDEYEKLTTPPRQG
nr:uncharacterized protein LOC128696178 [Cherax quadricarinatus]